MIEAEPRITKSESFFQELIAWGRRVALDLNAATTKLLNVVAFTVGSSNVVRIMAPPSTGSGYVGFGASTSATLVLNKASGAAGNISNIIGQTNNVDRWQLQVGNGGQETGANAGSDFGLYRYTDAGAFLGTAFSIARSTGHAYFENAVHCNPTAGFRTNGHYASGGNYYATGLVTNPNWQDVFWQAYHAPGVEAGLLISMMTVGSWTFKNNGNATAPGAWVDLSDGRVKINRQRLTGARAKVAALTGYTVERTDLKNMDGSLITQDCLIAQDLEPVLPNSVERSMRTIQAGVQFDGEVLEEQRTVMDFRSVNYNGVTALLVEDANAMAARIDTLESLLTSALAEIENLKGAANG